MAQLTAAGCHTNSTLTVVQGVFTMPMMFKLLFVGYETPGLSLQINIPDLLLKLVITILGPSVAGKVWRGKCGHPG